MSRSRKAVVALCALLASGLITVAVAWADSPHFVRADAARSGDNLVVSFKEAGLGNNQTVTIVASAFGTATYQCFNGGGNHPQAANKEVVTGLVQVSGDFTSGKNGSISNSLTVNPPGPGSFSCPPGQHLVGPTDVSYTNVQVSDATNGVSQPIPGVY